MDTIFQGLSSRRFQASQAALRMSSEVGKTRFERWDSRRDELYPTVGDGMK